MPFHRKISPEVRAYARFLRLENKIRFKDIAEKCDISIRSAKRILSTDLNRQPGNGPGRRTRGRPRMLDTRMERRLLRALPKLRNTEGTFSVKRLLQVAGLSSLNNSLRTVQRVLNRHGYFYLQARKKGLMNAKDMRLRVRFARQMKTEYNENIWKRGIAFYLDGASFVHKYNPMDQARAPRTRVWRKKSEGLTPGCLSKGQKVGSGGRSVKVIVAISYNKGVICCEPYEEMNGDFFATFIDEYFESIFRKSRKRNSRLFLQDGDPSQNSKKAKQAMGRANVQLLKIPARSPDLNPIENIFKFVGEKLRAEALQRKITHESFDEFKARVITTTMSILRDYIDKVIQSMSKRMNLIIEKKGQRLKY